LNFSLNYLRFQVYDHRLSTPSVGAGEALVIDEKKPGADKPPANAAAIIIVKSFTLSAPMVRFRQTGLPKPRNRSIHYLDPANLFRSSFLSAFSSMSALAQGMLASARRSARSLWS